MSRLGGPLGSLALCVALTGCDGAPPADDTGTSPGVAAARPGAGPVDAGPPIDAFVMPPSAACDPGPSPSTTVQAPTLLATLTDRWQEGWLASPAVADLDGDGTNEIVLARAELLLVFHLDGSIVGRVEVDGRIWASPIVAELVSSHPGLEIAFAERENVHVVGLDGAELPGFPHAWRDELRSIAAGDVDGDGALELVVVTTQPLEAGGQRDIVLVLETDGSVHPGFPPNTTGAAGCDDTCAVTGGYDQNLALGDVTGDGAAEIFATQDNAYLSLHDGTGRAFDAAEIFVDVTKIQGVRFLHDYAEAQQGYAEDELTANQAHFTNSAPAIADLDGDGTRELVVLGSVQNARQTDRLRGVGLWAFHPDGTRLAAWTTPFHAPDYLAGLWDYADTNVVAATNQVSIADLFPDRAGPELVFAGFDGRIHCVGADASAIWQSPYTTSDRVLTGGVAIADLSQDGVPELVFATYSPDADQSALVVLSATGTELHRVPLPARGAMAVPTIADVDRDGDLEIVVSLKDGEDRVRSALVYTVPGSGTACLPWPTGRRDLLRDGLVP
ncbi:MAG: VCBS repeat-containing protein [Sandaracinaceae bacterium]|nr:VCBS repeat-containing protein [Sandaracinaceae bacterium]